METKFLREINELQTSAEEELIASDALKNEYRRYVRIIGPHPMSFEDWKECSPDSVYHQGHPCQHLCRWWLIIRALKHYKQRPLIVAVEKFFTLTT